MLSRSEVFISFRGNNWMLENSSGRVCSRVATHDLHSSMLENGLNSGVTETEE